MNAKTPPIALVLIMLLFGSMIYLTKTAWDLYHALTLVPAGVLVLGVLRFMEHQAKVRRKSETERSERRPGRRNRSYQTPVAFVALGASVYAVLFVSLAYAFAFIGSKVPAVYSMFYDREFLTFVAETELIAGADADNVRLATNPEAASDRIEQRFEEDPEMPSHQAERLAQWRYDLLVEIGMREQSDVWKKAVWAEAVKWGKTHGIDTSVVEALMSKTQPTPTPMPTFTPQPTYTPPPTYTPQPTFTPYPTAQGQPTLPKGYNDCVGAVFIEQRELATNELLRLYGCQDDGLYKVVWLLAETEYRPAKQYSSLIFEDDQTGATFIPGNRNAFTVTVKDGHMVVK